MPSDIAERDDKSPQEIVDAAAEASRRDVFFKELQRACASLPPKDQAEERAEIEVWNTTLLDGLAKNEP
jgi:hypothetical protein